MRIVNYIVDWLTQGGAIIILAMLCYMLHPLFEAKKQSAKTLQSREAWAFAEQVANIAVNSLVSSEKNGEEKFKEATDMVQHVMEVNNFKLNDKSAQTLVQAAYEKSPLTGKKEEVPGK